MKVGSLTNYDQTQCFSTHLTTFAGGFIVLPSPINWNYVFVNADFMKNKTVYLTVICVSVLYVLLAIYARHKDKKDLEKLRVIALPDNHQSDHYLYQIIVFTGHRKNSGTKSKVRFEENKNFLSNDLNRFILFFRAMMMIHKFEHLMIETERFYNVMELMHLL